MRDLGQLKIEEGSEGRKKEAGEGESCHGDRASQDQDSWSPR